MLPQKFRLTKERDFKRLYKTGKSLNLKYLKLLWLDNNQDNPRFGIVVSKNALSLASQRNLLKRKIAGLVYPKVLKPFFGNKDMIILAKSLDKTKIPEALEELKNALKKLI